MGKRQNRSDKYQWLLLESVFAPEMWDAFSNNDSISHRMNPFEYNEELLNLEDELKVEFWKVIDDILTDRQKQIIQLYSEGYTQMEIATLLDVNQSSINKSLNGNVDYKNGKKLYGGCKKKIKKSLDSNKKIIELLRKMSELRVQKM